MNNDISAQTKPPVGPAVPGVVEVEVQKHFNELRSKLLDGRAACIVIILAFFGVVIAIAAFLVFGRFRKIETEAKDNIWQPADERF